MDIKVEVQNLPLSNPPLVSSGLAEFLAWWNSPITRLLFRVLEFLFEYKIWLLIVFFGFAKIFEIGRELYLARRTKRQILTGLFIEIKLNTGGLDDALHYRLRLDWMVERVADGMPVLLRSSHSDLFYRAHTTSLASLDPSMVAKIVKFYTYLDSADKDIRASREPEFVRISRKGRMNTLNSAVDSFCRARTLGHQICDDLLRIYPHIAKATAL
ncbi:hypothetical protein [Prosthecomicrobium sp. N25]|uniref:hypothetical protein n=1 Tax=Prosthecomicrobium sp. N25 TaxID=3129254 RepID=UPI0030789A71